MALKLEKMFEKKIDKSKVFGKSGIHYEWEREDKPSQIQLKKEKGFDYCTDSEITCSFAKQDPETKRWYWEEYGEKQVLMQCSEEHRKAFDQYQAQKAARTESALSQKHGNEGDPVSSEHKIGRKKKGRRVYNVKRKR